MQQQQFQSTESRTSVSAVLHRSQISTHDGSGGDNDSSGHSNLNSEEGSSKEGDSSLTDIVSHAVGRFVRTWDRK
jgi:hypothetical protein